MAQLYDRYQPDLIVFTRLFGTNLHVVKSQKRGIPVVCGWKVGQLYLQTLSGGSDRMAV